MGRLSSLANSFQRKSILLSLLLFSSIAMASIEPGNLMVLGDFILSSQTASTVPYLDSSKVLTSSAVTPTELGYVSGVTSSIQTQVDAKVPKSAFTAAGDLLYGSGSGTYSVLSDGSSGQVLKTDGAGTLSWTDVTASGVTAYGAMMNHGNDCAFVRTGTTFGDFAADSSCTFTTEVNSNMGTVTSYVDGSTNPLPGFSFTPPTTGLYNVCYTASTFGSVASAGDLELYDGTTEYCKTSITRTTARSQMSACCLIPIASTSAMSLWLRGAAESSGTLTIQATGNLSNAIVWNIHKVGN